MVSGRFDSYPQEFAALHEWHGALLVVKSMRDTFSLDDYEPEYDDVSEYHNDDDTPFDHKKSPADGAIEHRQKAKGEKGNGTSTAPSNDATHHQTSLEDPEKRKSVSERVNNRREGKAHRNVSEDDNNDPANW